MNESKSFDKIVPYALVRLATNIHQQKSNIARTIFIISWNASIEKSHMANPHVNQKENRLTID